MKIENSFCSTNIANRDIYAYLYNMPNNMEAYKNPRFNMSTFSHLCIYGYAPSNNFKVDVEVFLENGSVAFKKSYDVNLENNTTEYEVEVADGYFKLTQLVEYMHELPFKILVEINYNNTARAKEIPCIYHKLYGKVEDFDGNPFKAYVKLSPDDFEDGIGTWCDNEGNYEIVLPERIYNSVFVDDETYGINTAEAWGWHIIMDSDQKLDFKVGTGEVYNLNAWANNGGGRTYFISFRPMLLMPKRDLKSNDTIISNEDIFANIYDCEVDGNPLKVLDLSPELNKNSIKVLIDGIDVDIYSVDKYLEMNSSAMAMPAYIIQVGIEKIKKNGRHTIKVEYYSEKENKGITYCGRSMGYYQAYMNFDGLFL